MTLRQFGAAGGCCGHRLTASPALAQTEIQWWHAMTGANNDVVVKLAERIQRLAEATTRSSPTYKGSYPDTMNAGIAAFRAGNAPHIMQVFEVGTATMMAAKGAVKPVYELMEEAGEKFDPEGLSARHHRLLLDREGRDAVVPVQLVLDGDVGQQGRAEEGRHRRDPEDLAGGVRGRQEAEGGGLRHLRLLQRLGRPGRNLEQFSAWHNVPLATKANGLDGFDTELKFNARCMSSISRRWSSCRRTRPTTIPAAPTPAKAASPPANARSS